jgi:serine/threonine protein kinase
MKLSADAVLFGLRLLEEQAVDGTGLGAHLRAVAAGAAPDQVVALQERLLAVSPELAERICTLAAERRYAPVDCPGCRARLRASTQQAESSSYCPLCGEALSAAPRLLFLEDRAGGLRAAEEGAPYALRPPARKFAHFELTRLVGRGGAGRVYEALNTRTGLVVALKLLQFQPLESSAASFRRLRREGQAAASIVHENVVPVLDLGVAEGIGYVEMEFVRGESLRERVRREGALAPAEAVRLCGQMLAGLGAVHSRGIVHRDVKPANVLLDEQGRARLTDFGISRFLEETTSLSTGDRLVGSPHFMAPEQWRGEQVGPAADLYAAGMVLYHCLTGRLPYEGHPTAALMYKHLYEPVLGDEWASPVPDRLAQAIRRATAKRPEERFAGTEEFAEALAGAGSP